MPLLLEHMEHLFSLFSSSVRKTAFEVLKVDLVDNPEKHIASVNKLLNSTKTLQKALLYLSDIIPYLSQEIIVSNATFWVNVCMSIHNFDDVNFIVLSKIIDRAHSSPDFDKKFLNDIIQGILKLCLNHQRSLESEAALICLTSCLKHYPGWFKQHIKNVNNHLMCFLDNGNQKLVHQAGIAFCCLQQTGGAGTKDENYINNFSQQFSRLCSTVHVLYDALFERLLEVDKVVKNSELPYEFPVAIEQAYSVESYYFKTFERLVNCFTYLRLMILKKFAAEKRIKMQVVIDIINRGICQHICITQDVSLERQVLAALITSLQIQIFKFLRACIASFQRKLLPVSYSVTKLLLGTVNRIQSCKCFNANNCYKKEVYKTLSVWIRLVRRLELGLEKKLITCIDRDITPIQHEVILRTDNNIYKNKSKKWKKRALTEETVTGVMNSYTQSISSDILIQIECKTKAALDALSELLEGEKLRLGNKHIYFLKIVKLLFDVQANRPSPPYGSKDCQLALYKVFISFIEQGDISLYNIQNSIQILNKGMCDSNASISNECRRGLGIFEKLSNPITQSLCVKCSHEEDVNNSEDEMYTLEIQHSTEVNGVEDSRRAVENMRQEYDMESEHAVINKTTNVDKIINIVDVRIVEPPVISRGYSTETEIVEAEVIDCEETLSESEKILEGPGMIPNPENIDDSSVVCDLTTSDVDDCENNEPDIKRLKICDDEHVNGKVEVSSINLDDISISENVDCDMETTENPDGKVDDEIILQDSEEEDMINSFVEDIIDG